MADETTPSTVTPVTETNAGPPETTAQQTESTAQPAETQVPNDAQAPAESQPPPDAPPAATDTPPATTQASAEVQVGDTGSSPTATAPNEPEPAAAPTVAEARESRIQFLSAVVRLCTEGYAIAENSGKLTDAVTELQSALKESAGEQNAPLLMAILGKIRELPIPTDLTSWTTLASEVYALWRQSFALSSDQEMNQLLHALGDSIESARIVGELALRSDKQGWKALTPAQFDAIVDGHQSKELQAIGVKPQSIIPLINAVSEAKRFLAAKVEHERVAVAASA
jgi:hypothetical protein